MLVVVALLLLRNVTFFPNPTWVTVIYIFGLACLTASSLLLVVVIALAAFIGRWDSDVLGSSSSRSFSLSPTLRC